MSVCSECCVLSGRGLCDEMITRPEESYRLWCLSVCDMWGANEEEGHGQGQLGGYRAKRKKEKKYLNKEKGMYGIIIMIRAE